MKKTDPRLLILFLSVLALLCPLLFPQPLLSILLPAACLLAAGVVLYRNLGPLSGLQDDHPKVGTLRLVTAFNCMLLLLCTVSAALLATGAIHLSERDEQYLAAAIVSILILFIGNLAPKLPRTGHTGLRLPWTVADDDAWICAHRILGYISFPLACFYLAGTFATGCVEPLTGLVMLLWIGIPGALSYRVYRQKFPRK